MKKVITGQAAADLLSQVQTLVAEHLRANADEALYASGAKDIKELLDAAGIIAGHCIARV